MSPAPPEDHPNHYGEQLFHHDVTAHHNVIVVGQHIPGVENRAADSLSRNDTATFYSQVPLTDKDPTVIPPELKEMLVSCRPDWTSITWTSLLKKFLGRV